jgi:hypothetical protein
VTHNSVILYQKESPGVVGSVSANPVIPRVTRLLPLSDAPRGIRVPGLTLSPILRLRCPLRWAFYACVEVFQGFLSTRRRRLRAYTIRGDRERRWVRRPSNWRSAPFSLALTLPGIISETFGSLFPS